VTTDRGGAPVIAIRRELISAELAALGIDLSSALGDLLIEELAFALYPSPHEGKVATYGSILTAESKFDPYGGSATVIDVGNVDLNRELADGLSSFLWRYPSQPGCPKVICYTKERLAHELAVFTVRDDILRARDHDERSPAGVDDFVVIQRIGSGVRVLCREGVVFVRNNLWTHHPYQYAFKLDDMVETLWPSRPKLPIIARHISRVAVHLLSPAGIGATLGWMVEPCDERLISRHNQILLHGNDDNGLQIGANRATHWAFASIASQRDGMFLIDASGTAIAANIFINLPTSDKEAPSDGATRQRSAREGSRDFPGVIVTVSSDGPVRAYYGGELRLSTRATDHATAIDSS
jgi:hypothetical protein